MKTLFAVIFFSQIIHINSYALEDDPVKKIDNKSNSFVSKYLGNPEEIEALGNYLTLATKEAKKKKKPFYQEDVDSNRLACTHCPTHLQLTGSINAVLQKMRKSLEEDNQDSVAVDINRLNFLFYTVKSRQDDGQVKCERFRDMTPNLKPTTFEGRFDLMAEDDFKFPPGSQLQLLDPKSEEIIYYYRGEGPQRNIIVKAMLTKDGGKFQYFYYRPSEKEKNPYGLPSLGPEPADDDVTILQRVQPQNTNKDEGEDLSKNKYSLVVKPKVETRLKVIPKNVHIAKGEVRQNIPGVGLKVTGESALSLKGNQASANLLNEDGYSFIKVAVKTSLKGESTHTVEIPYEVRVTAPEVDNPEAGVKAVGTLGDTTSDSSVKLQITDGETQYVRTEAVRSKKSGRTSFTVAKDFPISPNSIVTVGAGRNEERRNYVTLQHRKSIGENITMILDVRLDQNRNKTFTYQMKAAF